MNNKGQMQGVGLFLGLFVGVIVVLSLMTGSIFPNIGELTDTVTVTNQAFTFPASGASIVLTGKSVSNVVVVNQTGGVTIASGNYTITNNDVSTGTIRATLTSVAGQAGTFNGTGVNISYVYQPLGYISDAGARNFADVLPILLALAVIAFVIGRAYSNGDLDFFK